MPASGKKAMKRAARAAAYDSDDEEIGKLSGPKERAARVNPTAEDGEDGPTMEDLEGMSDDDEDDEEGGEDDSDEDGPLEEGPLTDLRAVEKRMRTSARVLTNWRELGPATGK
jgi:ribosomal RNA methyltransferase Nop2